MTSQAIVRVLLSLLLLCTQQLAAVHVVSHLGGSLERPVALVLDSGNTSDLSSAVAQHQSCTQCLAFAQLAGPLPSSPVALALLGQSTTDAPGADARAVFALAILAFRSRAPPVLS